MQLAQMDAFGYEMGLDELQACALRFEGITVDALRRSNRGGALAGTAQDTSNANAQHLIPMRGGYRGRGRGRGGDRGGRGGSGSQPRKCYNCGSSDHLSSKCDKPHVPGHAPAGWVPKTRTSSGNA